ncbi:GNAT family N-acetyltransferase [Kibdelosporangium aridum]|uniref:Acetyltransferase (GNAT) family protein n=1 Tax=Kibdelosporangium aridum TaxID=2030 RepID=A0A1Y5XFE5_KIBAR|nr:GNAT family N-acetyltransferase [Kibdelosporangium aridum]SMC85980.1 Acetyltransferase (GNAT) family protein [Kibdelosporangium aridum]
MRVVELSEKTWPAQERLFGPRGAAEGCWCMYFRLPNADFMRGKGEPNRRAARKLARSSEPVGLLAMEGDDAIGWVAVAPRSVYRRLDRSKVAAPPDPDEDLTGVWSVTCFFIHRTARRKGVGAELLQAAIKYATKKGAKVIEAYPVDTKGGKASSGELYHGTLSMFLDAGFMLVEHRGVRRALVRKPVG